MITIIAGSRNFADDILVREAVEASGFDITEVISGGARGIDKCGERWATKNRIPYQVVYADWDKYGKSAGYRRNQRMADMAEALIAIWDGQSKGTLHMIHIAKAKGLAVYVHQL